MMPALHVHEAVLKARAALRDEFAQQLPSGDSGTYLHWLEDQLVNARDQRDKAWIGAHEIRDERDVANEKLRLYHGGLDQAARAIVAMEKDLGHRRDLIGRCRDHLANHDADPDHITPPSLVDEINKQIGERE